MSGRRWRGLLRVGPGLRGHDSRSLAVKRSALQLVGTDRKLASSCLSHLLLCLVGCFFNSSPSLEICLSVFFPCGLGQMEAGEGPSQASRELCFPIGREPISGIVDSGSRTGQNDCLLFSLFSLWLHRNRTFMRQHARKCLVSRCFL